MSPAEDALAVAAALAEPFDPAEIKWKPGSVSGNRCLAIGYVDARLVAERLDDVLGVVGWQDSYECLPDGAVVCRLRCKIGGEWITKEDVGAQSEQPDEGDRRKAAFSDALKRAAVKFGVGRYLYRLPPQWLDYDPQKRRIVGTPRLPAEALPGASHPVAAKPAPATARPAVPASIGEERAKLLDEQWLAAGVAPRTVCEAYKVASLALLTPAQADAVRNRLALKLKGGAA